MPSSVVLSEKVRVQIYPLHITVHRNTIRGERHVNVPKRVVLYALHIQDMINQREVHASNTSVLIDTCEEEWKVQKSFFYEEVYVGFHKYHRGERVG